MDDLPEDTVHPLTRGAWRAWLEANHDRAKGVWLVTFRKETGEPRVEYDEAVEEALCFGWVDSKPRKLDDRRGMLYFAPRRAGSGWSAPNKARVERLLAAGLMAPAGLAKVEAARRDGSWTALDEVEALVVPGDLAAALADLPPARENFDAFPRSARRGILEWIVSARTPGTRARRVEETA
ncbi:YdeI/OmpD-associated family protein, partial [Deinococcus pimensis]|uniref:YdeI/OmpD-associated family protein n=1 Tax=Deinococcus pimensis TaxID=309888 RepID=UPI0005EB93BF